MRIERRKADGQQVRGLTLTELFGDDQMLRHGAEIVVRERRVVPRVEQRRRGVRRANRFFEDMRERLLVGRFARRLVGELVGGCRLQAVPRLELLLGDRMRLQERFDRARRLRREGIGGDETNPAILFPHDGRVGPPMTSEADGRPRLERQRHDTWPALGLMSQFIREVADQVAFGTVLLVAPATTKQQVVRGAVVGARHERVRTPLVPLVVDEAMRGRQHASPDGGVSGAGLRDAVRIGGLGEDGALRQDLLQSAGPGVRVHRHVVSPELIRDEQYDERWRCRGTAGRGGPAGCRGLRSGAAGEQKGQRHCQYPGTHEDSSPRHLVELYPLAIPALCMSAHVTSLQRL